MFDESPGYVLDSGYEIIKITRSSWQTAGVKKNGTGYGTNNY